MKPARYWPLLTLPLLLAGCLTDPTEVYRKSAEQAEEIRERLETLKEPDARGLVRTHEGPYLDSRPITRSASHAYLDEQVSMHVDGLPLDLTLERALAQLSRPTPVSYAAPRDEDEEKKQPKIQTLPVTLRFDGRFEDLLEAIADATDLGYEIGDRGALRWSRFITRTYSLWRIPGNRSFAMGGSISSSSAVGGGGSGGVDAGPIGSDSASLNSSGNFWTELRTTLEAIMRDEDDEVVISESQGTITVAGLAPNVRTAGRYIQKINEDLARQILLEVQVLEVNTQDEGNVGVDWAVFRETLAAGPDGGVETSFTEVTDGGILTPGSSNLGTTLPSFAFRGRRAGTAAAFAVSALREQGTVSVQTSPRVVTLNGEMARILMLEDRGIVAETETTITQGVATTEVQTGTISTGFSLHILPKVVRDDILLQASVSVSSLQGITNVRANDVEVQLPAVLRNVFYQSALLQSEQLLLIGGIQRQRAARDSAHLPGVEALGTTRGEASNTEIVLLITPTLIAGGSPGS